MTLRVPEKAATSVPDVALTVNVDQTASVRQREFRMVAAHASVVASARVKSASVETSASARDAREKLNSLTRLTTAQ